MLDFIQKLHYFIAEKKLFLLEDKLLITVSGGVDSVVLATALHKLGYKFAIAHCNFQLRDAESEGDEAFVSQLAANMAVPFFSKKFDTEEYAKEKGISIQMAARELRYAWFEEIRSENGFYCIVTAHHQNDALETILLNLVRGTGLAGFHGILARNGRISRPLLFATKQEVENFASEHRLEWREDSSNSSSKYARNLIRNEVIPLLKKINPSLESTIQRTVRKVSMAEAQLKTAVKKKQKQMMVWNGQIGRIDIGLVSSESDPLFVLSSILRDFGFDLDISKQILESAESIPGKIFHSTTHRLLKDRQNWLLKSNENDDFTLAVVMQNTKKAWLPNWNYLNIKVLEGGLDLVEKLKQKEALFFDFDKLTFPITVRRWENGDVFSPFGMSGKKKLSDFLVDLKLSLFDKENVAVLESGGEILAVVGVIGQRASQHCLVDGNTKRVWRAQLGFLR